uniref:Dihydroflavonol 4-reductase n=1 Tax=Dryopteris erythrosora TaxID=239562 RepID=A0A5P8I1Z5_9MONI|nr:dihydroflavonol 4-reductase [Dryopteris erythrosora]
MEKVVCVTGASGFIASWLVKLLLERGYIVRASVRDPENAVKTAHLRALPHANERLKLCKADLLEEGSFDIAVDGCEGVFHTASPFFVNTDNPQKDLIDPAVKGTVNVLNACGKAKSVRRVVLTSSIAAVMFRPSRKPEDVVDESFYSDPEFCKQNNLWYPLSKTEAENEAWKISKVQGLDLVTINPVMVVGPLLQPTLNTSSGAVLRFLTGAASTYPNTAAGWVHVKDVAEAHILAYEVPEASGRYICAERVLHYESLVKILQALFPDVPLPTKCADESSPRAPEYKVCCDKVKSLGLKFTPIEEALKECVESLIQLKFLSKP